MSLRQQIWSLSRRLDKMEGAWKWRLPKAEATLLEHDARLMALEDARIAADLDVCTRPSPHVCGVDNPCNGLPRLSCPCATGSPENFEDPSRDCPYHGQRAGLAHRWAEPVSPFRQEECPVKINVNGRDYQCQSPDVAHEPCYAILPGGVLTWPRDLAS